MYWTQLLSKSQEELQQRLKDLDQQEDQVLKESVIDRLADRDTTVADAKLARIEAQQRMANAVLNQINGKVLTDDEILMYNMNKILLDESYFESDQHLLAIQEAKENKKKNV